MASKKVRQKISYVLEIEPLSVGHRLGVNGLAYDSDNSILYSGGRDGVLCAWDMHLDKPTKAAITDTTDNAPKAATNGDSSKPAVSPAKQTATSRAQTQAHMHWINDIALAQNNSVVVTASSDLLVKAWRPRAGDNNDEPAILGRHEDYAKCVASPGQQATWVASGGLDRRIRLWDLQGGSSTNQILEIDVSGEERAEKGSVYALRATHSLLASGGPESTVRLWDPRTGKNITKFVGHTDNVRAILINAAGDTVLTASADQTVKVWSVTAGRCMHTLTMHSDSVWALYAKRADLGLFYSGDRSGMVVKTDVRGSLDDMDAGLSVAVAHEHGGVNKVVASDGFIWTATSSSSINRWADIDTAAALQRLQQQQQQPSRPFSPETLRPHSSSVSTTKSGAGGANGTGAISSLSPAAGLDIPVRSILRISNTARFPRLTPADTVTLSGSSLHGRKNSEAAATVVTDDEAAAAAADEAGVEPLQRLPVETIEGNFGLVKHRLLNDRRRALTLDTAGEVLLWDLIQCKQLQRFGKRHLEDVEPEVNTTEAVSPWCSIDVSSGNLMVVLDPYNCFDAEMYADELVQDEPLEIREDQRINLGKWILRYLFANLVDEEVRRDEVYRAKLNEVIDKRIEAVAAAEAAAAAAAAGTYSMLDVAGSETALTNGADKRASQASRSSDDGVNGEATNGTNGANGTGLALTKTTTTGGADADRETTKSPGAFGKKFRMGMSFGTKKLGRSASTSVPEKPEKPAGAAAATSGTAAASSAVVDGTAEEGSETGSAAADADTSFAGVVQRMRAEYDRAAAAATSLMADATALVRVESRITPCGTDEAPALRLPSNTMVIIQEEMQGGNMEVYRGTVGTAGRARDVDKIERCAPRWLAEALLTNSAMGKESHKVAFILLPGDASLPNVATPDGSSRLNANRMLRVKKILAYVAEKIEGPIEGKPAMEEVGEVDDGDREKKEEEVEEKKEEQEEVPADTEKPAGSELRPEEYLELYCNEQRLPDSMSLATVRAHIWKNSSDILLYYRTNGRKEIRRAA